MLNMPMCSVFRSTLQPNRSLPRRNRLARRSRSRPSVPIATHLEIRFPRVAGLSSRTARRTADRQFNDDSVLGIDPRSCRAHLSRRKAGIIGEGVELNLEHLGDMRRSTLALSRHETICSTRNGAIPAKNPSSISSGSSNALPRNGSTPASFAKAALFRRSSCTRNWQTWLANGSRLLSFATQFGKSPIKTILDPYNPTGSTSHVKFTTSKTDRWETDARRCHINWVILDSDWEG